MYKKAEQLETESENFELPFEASMLVHFRQRLEMDLVNKINSRMCEKNGEEVESEKKSPKVVTKKKA